VRRHEPLVVLGPTASGKSDVAMAFAVESAGSESRMFEIVAIDAMQVYRRMDIGTAKPSAADRAAVPHHGIDLVEPSEDFAVPAFTATVDAAIDDIDRRGRRAVLVAGTGLYLRAITDPMDVPGTWPAIRAAFEARAEAHGIAPLFAELQERDPDAAAKMEPTNARRIVRALEVCEGSGRRFSAFGQGLSSYPPVPFRMVGLRWPRSVLAARIAVRVERMVADGLVDEVAGLLAEPGGLSRTARQALGYKEIIDHLEGRAALAEAIERVITRTRQFAVRQERWFRRDPRIHWVDIEHEPIAEVVPILREWSAR
jgi:tRNA dimethylallyltransferase